MTYSLTLRIPLGRRLTNVEMDNNFLYLQSLITGSSSIDGTQGPQGPQGEIGPQGYGQQGPEGPTGSYGPQGYQGPTGSASTEYLPTPMISLRKKNIGDFPEWSSVLSISVDWLNETVEFTNSAGEILHLDVSVVNGTGYVGVGTYPIITISNFLSSGLEFQIEQYQSSEYYYFNGGETISELITTYLGGFIIYTNDGGASYDLGINFKRRSENGDSIKHFIDTSSRRNQSYSDIFNTDYPLGYYIEKFDIYFNSFGNREWINLPDKKVELLIPSNKNHSGPVNGNKDYSSLSLVHPANTSNENLFIYGTIFSGGSKSGYDKITATSNDIHLGLTEWRLDENLNSFSPDNTLPNGRNILNNPNITVEIDISRYIKKLSDGRSHLRYPIDFTSGDRMRIKSNGDIKLNETNQKVYKRNLIFFFRLSAGVPDSLSPDGKSAAYRLYFSEISSPGSFLTIDFGYGITASYINTDSTITDLYTMSSELQNKGFSILKIDNTSNISSGDNAYWYMDIRRTEYVEDILPTAIIDEGTTIIVDISQISESWAPNTRYLKRLFSDISLPVYVSPKIDEFVDDINNPTNSKILCYGHKVKLGNK